MGRKDSKLDRNTLFAAQRHFLEKILDHKGLRNRKVTVPDDNGKPIVFEFELDLDGVRPFATLMRIADDDWGAFKTKEVMYGNAEDGNPKWLKVSLEVDLRGAE